MRTAKPWLWLLPISVFITMTGCGGGSSTGGDVALDNKCFDPSLYSMGSTVDTTVASSTSSDQVYVFASMLSTVTATDAVFGENKNLTQRTTSRGVHSEDINGNWISSIGSADGVFYEKPEAQGIATLYGARISSKNHGYFFSTTKTYSPPFSDGRASLKIGEEASYTATGTLEEISPYNPPSLSSFTESMKVKFVGIEAIATGAKTINACRYDITKPLPEGNYLAKEWWHRGQIIRLESTYGSSSGIYTEKMTSLKINGTPIF